MRNILEAGIVERLAFDCENQLIVRDGKSVQLSPKAFDVLSYLFAKPQQLITKDELLNAVWPDVCVVDAVLKNTIRELRKILHDDSRSPLFIETVHRRGYRFIGEQRLSSVQRAPDISRPISSPQNNSHNESSIVGREKELTAITHHWKRAQQGFRAGVTINGDPGIGKSTLVDTWMQQVSSDNKDVLIARTGCTAGAKQRSYMSLFDALSQLCKDSESTWVCDLLIESAPGLSTQLPWLTHHNCYQTTCTHKSASQPEKLLLEAVEFIERLAQEKAFVWFIDDAHYCDSDTRELIEYLLRRKSHARLLILTTHCPWHSSNDDNAIPIISEAWARESAAEEIHLDCLEKSAIKKYLERRFQNSVIPKELTNSVYKESGGHPLFVSGITDKLCKDQAEQSLDDKGYVGKSFSDSAAAIPEIVCRRMDTEIVTLNANQFRLLQAASITLVDGFSAAAVATLLDQEIVEIEDLCDELARTNRWIRRYDSRQWPDGTLAQLYGFSNPVYRDYLYQTLPAARRRQYHFKHGERLESAYGDDVAAIAENLAYHFEVGGQPRRVRHYKHLIPRYEKLKGIQLCNLKPHYHCGTLASGCTLSSQNSI